MNGLRKSKCHGGDQGHGQIQSHGSIIVSHIRVRVRASMSEGRKGQGENEFQSVSGSQ